MAYTLLKSACEGEGSAMSSSSSSLKPSNLAICSMRANSSEDLGIAAVLSSGWDWKVELDIHQGQHNTNDRRLKQ